MPNSSENQISICLFAQIYISMPNLRHSRLTNLIFVFSQNCFLLARLYKHVIKNLRFLFTSIVAFNIYTNSLPFLSLCNHVKSTHINFRQVGK